MPPGIPHVLVADETTPCDGARHDQLGESQFEKFFPLARVRGGETTLSMKEEVTASSLPKFSPSFERNPTMITFPDSKLEPTKTSGQREPLVELTTGEAQLSPSEQKIIRRLRRRDLCHRAARRLRSTLFFQLPY
jgi:hypothetical protein